MQEDEGEHAYTFPEARLAQMDEFWLRALMEEADEADGDYLSDLLSMIGRLLDGDLVLPMLCRRCSRLFEWTGSNTIYCSWACRCAEYRWRSKRELRIRHADCTSVTCRCAVPLGRLAAVGGVATSAA